MTDIMTPIQRHRCMSHIRSRNTKTEIKVRQWLWQHGYRYRLCVKGVPGKPDIVMRKYRTAIFVNGCFWHGHGVQVTGYTEQVTVGNSDSGVEIGKVGEKGVLYKVDRKRVENSECCRIPKTNRDFWVNKIRRNQERDQRNYEPLQENGWPVSSSGGFGRCLHLLFMGVLVFSLYLCKIFLRKQKDIEIWQRKK